MWVHNRTCLHVDEAEAMKDDDEVEEQMNMNAILCVLEYYYPHSVSKIELASLLQLSASKVDAILGFLTKYSVIRYDEESRTAAICEDFVSLP